MAEGYNRDLDKTIHKELVKAEKRLINVEVYSYNGGEAKVRLAPVGKNTNPNADSDKKWIKHKAISGLTKDEVSQLIVSLEKCKTKL